MTTHGPAPTAPHGTVSAYKRHLRHAEPPCAACRAAWAKWHRDNYKPRKRKGTGHGDNG